MRVLTLAFLVAPWAAGQTLQGVVDIHAHADPDVVPRSIDALSLVRLAKQRGLRGLVLKNHYEPTASLAWLARQQTQGIEVFGGIALNRAVGGVNPAAVDRFAAVKGHYGRIVWMPTFDAENQAKGQRPFVPVSKDGKLLPEVLEVLGIIAKHDLVMATGHSSPAENLLLIREAKRCGVKRLLVTHPLNKAIHMTVGQMKEAAAQGAYLEFVCNGFIGNQAEMSAKEYAAAMRAVGFEHVVLASDFGQAGNPLHPDGLVMAFRALRAEGIPAEAIEIMTKRNPAKLLGLE